MGVDPSMKTNLIGEVDPRLTQVSDKLSVDLDKFLLNYRTFDKRPLTEGEVMTALGRVIVRKSPTEQRIGEWLANISLAAAVVYRQLKGTGE